MATYLDPRSAICCRSRPAASRRVSIIAAILERPVIQKILTQLGLEPQPLLKTPAREPVPHHAG